MKKKENNWIKQKEWYGNPSLGLEAYTKFFPRKSVGKPIPVTVFGCTEPIQQEDEDGYKWITHGWKFVVAAGPNSTYSYSGGFTNEFASIEEQLKEIDALHKQGKLIY